MNAIIIHGAYGNPEENWIPWLKGELEKEGYSVYIPHFPTPEGQCLETWMETFKPYEQYLGSETILIGHSIGAAFILALLEKHRAKKAFLVAGFVQPLGNPEFDEINMTFYKEYDWVKIKENCTHFYVYSSNDDPYVSFRQGMLIGIQLGAGLSIIKGAGHFNAKSGYTTFERLKKDITKPF